MPPAGEPGVSHLSAFGESLGGDAAPPSRQIERSGSSRAGGAAPKKEACSDSLFFGEKVNWEPEPADKSAWEERERRFLSLKIQKAGDRTVFPLDSAAAGGQELRLPPSRGFVHHCAARSFIFGKFRYSRVYLR